MNESIFEAQREKLVEHQVQLLEMEALNDLTVFEELNDDHEIVILNQVQRCLRNLDDAISGKEYAREAIYTSLYYMQKAMREALEDKAEEKIPSTTQMYNEYITDSIENRKEMMEDR